MIREMYSEEKESLFDTIRKLNVVNEEYDDHLRGVERIQALEKGYEEIELDKARLRLDDQKMNLEARKILLEEDKLKLERDKFEAEQKPPKLIDRVLDFAKVLAAPVASVLGVIMILRAEGKDMYVGSKALGRVLKP